MLNKKGQEKGVCSRIDQGFFVMGTHFSDAGEGTCF